MGAQLTLLSSIRCRMTDVMGRMRRWSRCSSLFMLIRSLISSFVKLKSGCWQTNDQETVARRRTSYSRLPACLPCVPCTHPARPFPPYLQLVLEVPHPHAVGAGDGLDVVHHLMTRHHTTPLLSPSVSPHPNHDEEAPSAGGLWCGGVWLVTSSRIR